MVTVFSARWRRIVHLVACLLLTFAATDLLVPELCAAEKTVAEDSDHRNVPDQVDDDCFCCCSHIEQVAVVTVLAEDAPVMRDRGSDERLAFVEPRLLYRPPLHS